MRENNSISIGPDENVDDDTAQDGDTPYETPADKKQAGGTTDTKTGDGLPLSLLISILLMSAMVSGIMIRKRSIS